MPIYVYHCPDNQKTLEVLHSMHQTIATWGELCQVSELPLIIARRLMSGFQLQWELPREVSNEFDLPLGLHSLHW
ncbi:MAG: zinc ribbon domain-containing protein, partial [Cyanobacteria bacterium SID2]|nr:zinc ribbon domain-containing protein [Cyanobacteria bacterium SID2]